MKGLQVNPTLFPIRAIADQLEVPEESLLYYGEHMAKLKLDLLMADLPPRGKLIMVTAITPTSHGEGKTVVSIGLAQALARQGRRALLTLREPSLGPVFGLKGGATGGGRAQVLPAERINLHFTGDFHAITTAHNLLAATIDSHLHFGNELRFDVDNVFWPRAMDMNDRALRHIIVGLGGKQHGIPRETGFVITAASEIMAIMGLANSKADLRRRLENIVLGFNLSGRPIYARELNITGALMVLLNEALLPNLVQTSENTPALVHTGPFANIAHGTSSVISQLMGTRLADYVINESGFGADLGAEKYFNLAMRSSGLKPAVAVVIATAKALTAHGAPSNPAAPHDLAALDRGLANLAKHLDNLSKFHVPVVVAINRFPGDSKEEIKLIEEYCHSREIRCAIVEAYEKGGEGAMELASIVEGLAEGGPSSKTAPLYSLEDSLEEKIKIVATQIYGARDVSFESEARKRLRQFTDLGFGQLPICMAKTPASLTDQPHLLGAPRDWTLTITGAHLSAGAGFVVPIAGSMMLMPGLPRVSQATRLDVNDDGLITGMNY